MNQNKKVALLFPGQGAQYVGMGQDLYDAFDEARQVYDLANTILDFDIKALCFKDPESNLQKTRFAQAAIFVTSMAAFKVFESKFDLQGFKTYTAGLSLGEATALTAAGSFTLEEGIQFVRKRGLYMDEASVLSPGSMAAVMGMDLSAVKAICESTGAEIGNLNCPGQVVISGPTKFVEAAVMSCKENGARRVMMLEVSGAFHSTCMNSACDKIKSALDNVILKEPRFCVVSNLTGTPESNTDKIQVNLIKQMNHPTLWEDSMRYFLNEGVTNFYEIGPGKVLRGLMRKINSDIRVNTLGTTTDFELLTTEDADVTQR